MILAIIFALINRLRGWESGYQQFHSKYLCAVYLGVITGVYAWDWVIGVIVAMGWALWAARGWGDYFDFSSNKNDEIAQIDALLAPHVPSGALNDALSMSIRGLFILPLFIALSVYLLSPSPLLLGLGACLQGSFYYIGHRLWSDMSGRKTVFGELATGALHGILISLCI